MAKTKLVESFAVLPPAKKLPIQEGFKKVLYEGKEYKCVAAYTFPISRPNKENFNQRIYTDKLWERVIKEQKHIWEGAYGLCDHPTSEGSVKDAFCVWHNMRMSEDKSLLLCDAYLFGSLGRQAQEALEAGGKLGMSSVGYGDFGTDGKTVDAQTFELERPADWVMNPSYGVYGTNENQIDVMGPVEPIAAPAPVPVANVEPAPVQQIDTTPNQVSQVAALEAPPLEQGIVAPVEEEPKPQYRAPLSLEAKTATNSRSLKEKLMDKSQILLEKNFKLNIESQLKDIAKIESISERTAALKQVLQLFEDVDFAKELKERVESTLKAVETETVALAEKGKEVDSLKEKNESTTKAKTTLEEENKKIKETLETLQKKFKTAVSMLESLKGYTKKLKELHDITKAEKNGMVTAEEYRQLSKYTEDLEKRLNEKKGKLSDAKKEAFKKKWKEEGQVEIEIEDEDEEEDGMMTEEEGKEDEKKDDCEKKEGKVFKTQTRRLMEALAEEEDKKDDEKKDDEKEKKDDEKKEYVLDLRNRRAVEAYYEDLLEANPRVKEIKSKILACKTLVEAQMTYLKFKDSVEDSYEPTVKYMPTQEERKDKSGKKLSEGFQRISMNNIKRKGWI